ncbi:peptide chain release factor N(5)-glutamine methyltransferase [Balneolaceae bacterium ANBcel3]|nr:peptide chain release factor N(5)-glutamine methyltransferase [Balneolaceae bacterium ANBcel3]
MNAPTGHTRDWNVLRMLEFGTDYFEKKQVPSPRLSIEWLLSHVLNIKRLDLYLQYDRPLTEKNLAHLKPLVLRRGHHEPLQYITGETDFYNLTLSIQPGVLIPRPETEELVGFILNDLPKNTPFTLLDVGTGSGCIALAIKKERPDGRVTGIDLSEEALEVARVNSRKLDLDVEFIQSDLCSFEANEKMDVLVSNPPYIGTNEKSTLEKQVIRYEPEMALITSDVIRMYTNLSSLCRRLLKPGGLFYLEINDLYAEDLLPEFNSHSLSAVLKKDLSGKQRFIVGKTTA